MICVLKPRFGIVDRLADGRDDRMRVSRPFRDTDWIERSMMETSDRQIQRVGTVCG